jgi:hypothetical protein
MQRTQEEYEAFIENYLLRIFHRVIDINAKLQILEYLNKAIHERRSAFNLAKTYWGISYRSLLGDVTLSITKLFEGDRTVNSFLNNIEQNIDKITALNNDFEKKELKEQQKAINELSTLIDEQFELRNNIYAHIDKKYFDNPTKMNDDFNISFENIATINGTVYRVLNYYFGLIRGTDAASQLAGANDIQTLFNRVDWFFEKAKENFREESG